MAQNFIQPGGVITLIAPAGGALSGRPVKTGSMVCIALNSADAGQAYEAATDGVWQVAKAVGTAWVAGDKLYWDDTAKCFTKTATSNTAAGYARSAAAAADLIGEVLLRQIA